MPDMTGRDLLLKMVQADRASDKEAMTHASVAALVENQNLAMHNAHRMNAQVDAALKTKYAQCGMPDAYEPPEVSEDSMATMINCTFNGDEAVNKIATAVQAIGIEGNPPSQPSSPPQKKWKQWLGTLFAVGFGAALAFGAAAYFGDDPLKYNMTALPYKP